MRQCGAYPTDNVTAASGIPAVRLGAGHRVSVAWWHQSGGHWWFAGRHVHNDRCQGSISDAWNLHRPGHNDSSNKRRSSSRHEDGSVSEPTSSASFGRSQAYRCAFLASARRSICESCGCVHAHVDRRPRMHQPARRGADAHLHGDDCSGVAVRRVHWNIERRQNRARACLVSLLRDRGCRRLRKCVSPVRGAAERRDLSVNPGRNRCVSRAAGNRGAIQCSFPGLSHSARLISRGVLVVRGRHQR